MSGMLGNKDDGAFVNERLRNYRAAWDWLAHDVLGNLDLLLALAHEPLDEIVLAGDPADISGVLLRGAHPTRQGMCCRVEAFQAAALNELLGANGVDAVDRWLLHRPWMVPALRRTIALEPTGYAMLGYARDTPSGMLPAGRCLTLADGELVTASACGWTAATFMRMCLHGRPPWAIVVDEQIVCRAATGYATPWSEEVVSVWTHPAHRRQGHARQLVAALCNNILTRKPFAAYTTTQDNRASQQVAVAVGFTPTYELAEYIRTDVRMV